MCVFVYDLLTSKNLCNNNFGSLIIYSNAKNIQVCKNNEMYIKAIIFILAASKHKTYLRNGLKDVQKYLRKDEKG